MRLCAMKNALILTIAFTVVALTGFTTVAQSVDDFRELDAKFGPMQLAEIKQLAEAGNIDAQGVLGLYYSNGIRVSRDKRQAEYWYLKAAKQGHEDAQYNLGQMYRNGDLGRPDYESALYWYERAAENKVVYAPSNIAGMYYQGMGVPRSKLMATMWMIVARRLGDDRASSNLSILRRELSVADYARAEQLAREWIDKNGAVR